MGDVGALGLNRVFVAFKVKIKSINSTLAELKLDKSGIVLPLGMGVALFLVIHWYASLFFQSFFHHRYAAHAQFTMSKGWEKVFHILCFITQGSSYISARAYGLMHRLHHAHTDTEHDPHSPSYHGNAFMLLWQTRNSYNDIFKGTTEVALKYHKDLPEWKAFDRFAHNWVARLAWGLTYIGIYAWLATAWWQFLFLPLTFGMGALQGLAINWWAHKFGYSNFKMDNTSKNLIPVDLIFWGEGYHNNHHQYPGRANYAVKWFELDPGFMAVKALNYVGIVRLKVVAGS